MTDRFASSPTASRVAEFLAARDGRRHLEKFGWNPQIPIIVTKPQDRLTDLGSLAAEHQGPKLLAAIRPGTHELCFIYLSGNQPALSKVPAMDADAKVWDLFEQAEDSWSLTFRPDQWPHSMLAMRIPFYQPTGFSKTAP